MQRLLAFTTAILIPFALAACGEDAPTTTATTFNEADVRFAQQMVPHHEQAVEMAEIALDPYAGADIEVIDLANRIQQAQQAAAKSSG